MVKYKRTQVLRRSNLPNLLGKVCTVVKNAVYLLLFLTIRNVDAQFV